MLIDSSPAERAEKEEITKIILSFPTCDDEIPIDFSPCPTYVSETKSGKPKKEKTKREPSEYNKFISVCMKSKNIKGFGNAAPAMKECAAEWKQRKGQG